MLRTSSLSVATAARVAVKRDAIGRQPLEMDDGLRPRPRCRTFEHDDRHRSYGPNQLIDVVGRRGSRSLICLHCAPL